MSKLNFENILFDSFDTFKAFDELNLYMVNNTLPNTPKTIWQILNHLITWQEYQIEILNERVPLNDIAETETWVENDVMDLNLVNSAVLTFYDQINSIKIIISTLTFETPDIELKLKGIQDIIGHLAFHLGEVILIRRQLKDYPMPDEMSKFLSPK